VGVPVTSTLKFLVVTAFPLAVRVKVELCPGVTVAGENDADTPEGSAPIESNNLYDGGIPGVPLYPVLTCFVVLDPARTAAEPSDTK